MFVKYKQILLFTALILVPQCKGQLQCLTSTYVSCTNGTFRGGPDNIETRLILSMNFTCSGVIIGWTVSGRASEGTQFPKLQVWRANRSQGSDFYFKPGKDIQVDAEGTACEILTKTCGQIFQCRLSNDHQVSVQSGDILGVELPPLNDRAFELYFLGNRPDLRQNHFVFRYQLSSTVHIVSQQGISFYHRGDQLLLNLELSLASAATETPPITSSTASAATETPPTTSSTTHSQSTSTGLTIGVAVGGVLGGALITMAATLLTMVIINARRRNRIKGREEGKGGVVEGTNDEKEETDAMYSYVLTNPACPQQQIEMTDNECYATTTRVNVTSC